jgi:hypothetical protein
MNKLFDQYGVKLVGFDVVFAEPDESSGLKSLESLAKKELKDAPVFQSALKDLRPQLDYDAALRRGGEEPPGDSRLLLLQQGGRRKFGHSARAGLAGGNLQRAQA